MPVTIAVDAMGGDFAPGVNLKGALLALKDAPDLSVCLVGDKTVLADGLRREGAGESERLAIRHAAESISMEDHGAAVIRKKKGSSIHVGLTLVKDGGAQAFVSAGNSGAVMAGALFILGRLSGIERPAIVVKLPTAEGFVTILDAGANVDCKPSQLCQFAWMGSVYANIIEGVPNPRVGLLSNGSETHKGNDATREAHALLDGRDDLNYVGYVEGRDLFTGNTDVAVCDGFVGNVVLKVAEGLADTAFQWFRKQLRRDVRNLLGVVMMRRLLTEFKRKFDYQPYGAAPLLGVDGMVLIGHGSSSATAVRNGILTAKRGVEQDFLKRIRRHRPGQGEARK